MACKVLSNNYRKNMNIKIVYPSDEEPKPKPDWVCDYYYYIACNDVSGSEVHYRSRKSLDAVMNLWADNGRLKVVNLGRVG